MKHCLLLSPERPSADQIHLEWEQPKVSRSETAGYTLTLTVNVRKNEFELENYSQDSCEESLLNHLRRRYPGANHQVADEAGFCGFGIQRSLEQSDLHCIIVNPADVPSSDKDKKEKTTGSMPARKKSRGLSN